MIRTIFLIAMMAVLSACSEVNWESSKVNFGVNVDENGNLTIGIEGSLDLHSWPETAQEKAEEDLNSAGIVTSNVPLDAEQEKALTLIAEAALRHDVAPKTLAAVGWVESRLRNAKNPRSSASGVMQFITSTAKAYDLVDPFDVAANIDAGARLMRDNAQTLRKMLGVEPEPWHLYLAHQQGAGGAVDLLTASTKLAKDVVGSAEIALNTRKGSDVSTADFLKEWKQSFESALALFEVN